MANLYKIHVRTGCSCNPGACQRLLKLTSENVKQNFKEGHVCGDDKDLLNGVPTGSIRISFGYMSTRENADALLRMVEECFITKPVLKKLPNNWEQLKNNYRGLFTCENFKEKNLKNKFIVEYGQNSINNHHDIQLNRTKEFKMIRGKIVYLFLYPIKSCAAFVPTENWKLSSYGLEYDREWMIINNSGSAVTQKQYPKLCLIKPIIDLNNELLKLTFQDEKDLILPLNEVLTKKMEKCESKVCRDRVIGYDCGELASQWLNTVLNTEGLRLIRKFNRIDGRVNKKGECSKLSFSNQSQYLMINLKSVEWLKKKVKENNEKYNETVESILLRFRANIAIEFDEPFQENELDIIEIGEITFKTVSKCTRCQMICINQTNAEKTKEPLVTLSKNFNGKVEFGIYLSHENFSDISCNIKNNCEVIGKQLLDN